MVEIKTIEKDDFPPPLRTGGWHHSAAAAPPAGPNRICQGFLFVLKLAGIGQLVVKGN